MLYGIMRQESNHNSLKLRSFKYGSSDLIPFKYIPSVLIIVISIGENFKG